MNNRVQEEITAKRVLEGLAEVNRCFRDHAVRLRRTLTVTTQSRVEIVSYADGPCLEGYVEATGSNGDTICWCLDVHWNRDAWIIDATLDRKSGDRQKTIKELPTQIANTLDDFLETLKRTVSELLTMDNVEIPDRS
jgi:hypothetical protein